MGHSRVLIFVNRCAKYRKDPRLTVIKQASEKTLCGIRERPDGSESAGTNLAIKPVLMIYSMSTVIRDSVLGSEV